MTKPIKPTRRLFTDAAQYIHDHGHARNFLTTRDGRVCIAGAINAVSSGNPCTFGGVNSLDADRERVLGDVMRVIRETNEIPAPSHPDDFDEPNGSYAAVVDWNNAEGRTGDEVIAALEHAAAACPEDSATEVQS